VVLLVEQRFQAKLQMALHISTAVNDAQPKWNTKIEPINVDGDVKRRLKRWRDFHRRESGLYALL